MSSRPAEFLFTRPFAARRTRLHVVAGLLVFAGLASAQHDLDWARTIQPADAFGESDAFALRAGLNGETVAGGDFRGVTDIDPGPATMQITPEGGSDSYVITLDRTGALVAAKTINGPGNDSLLGLAVDGDGSIYVAGSFESTFDIDNGPGTTQLLSLGGSDGFVVKYDPTGAVEWARTFGSIFDSEQSDDVKVAPNGDIVIIGDFSGTIELNAPGKLSVTAAGERDIYVVRLQSDGTFVWGKTIGGLSDDLAFFVAVNGSDDIYVSGGFLGTADFDPGAATQPLTSAGSVDGFLLKLNSAGDFQWVRRIGGELNDQATEIALDSNDDIYLAGWVEEAASIGGQSVSADGSDAYLTKFLPDGSVEWIRLVGGSELDDAFGAAVTAQDKVFMTGTTAGTVDLDPTEGTTEYTATGDFDGFLVGLDTDGTFITGGGFGGLGFDQGLALAADSDDNLLLAGVATPPADVDPGGGAFSVNGPVTENGLILKLKGPESAPSTLGISGTVESDSGDVLTCATVRAEGMVDSVLVARTATVNADGTYEMRRLPTSTDGTSPTSYSVQAFAPGFVSEIAGVDPSDFGSGGTAALDFQLAPHSLAPEDVTSGIVVDEQMSDGATIVVALAGARVEALSDGLPLDPPVFTFTCAEGRFELPLPAGKGDVLLHFSAPQYNAQDVAPAPGGESLNVVLEPKFAFAKSIAGAVTRASNNEGIEGATVTANLPGGTLGLSVETDASGLFQITVPDSGEYFAEASAADFPPKSGITVVSDAFPVGQIDFALGEAGGGGGGCAANGVRSNSASDADALVLSAIAGALLLRRRAPHPKWAVYSS